MTIQLEALYQITRISSTVFHDYADKRSSDALSLHEITTQVATRFVDTNVLFTNTQTPLLENRPPDLRWP